MAINFRRAGIAALLSAILVIPVGAFAADDAGAVLALAGDCFVESGQARSPLKAGDAIHAGDVVNAAAGARLKLRLNDGSVISLGSGARLRIEAVAIGASAGRTVKLFLGAGLLRAVVTAFSQPSHFEIDTATGVAAVRSTDWFIEANPDSTQVGVLDGRVSLASAATGRAVQVPARWGARVEEGRDPVPARIWSAAEFNAVIARTALDQGR